MAQAHQEESPVDLANHTVKRKRGRPRKDETPAGSEPPKRNRRARIDGGSHGADPFVGQVVSGVLDGRFDAGYMLTVQVGGRGCVLRGLVFEPGLSVPISSTNDIAPNVKMFERNQVSVPIYCPRRSVARRDGSNRSAVGDLNACASQIDPAPDAKVKIIDEPKEEIPATSGNDAMTQMNVKPADDEDDEDDDEDDDGDDDDDDDAVLEADVASVKEERADEKMSVDVKHDVKPECGDDSEAQKAAGQGSCGSSSVRLHEDDDDHDDDDDDDDDVEARKKNRLEVCLQEEDSETKASESKGPSSSA